MSLLTSRRARKVAAAATTAGLVVGASLVMQATAANAAPLYGVTITSTTPLRVPAVLANRVIVITGTNFDEDQITGITLGADPDCANLQTYVVSSPTSISVKTPGNGTNSASVPGCAASTSQTTGEDITIIQTGGGTVVKQGSASAGVIFVPPPSLLAAASKPVITENSSGLLVANQVQALSPAGGQNIRLKATADFAFSGQPAAGLSGTLGGKPLTSVGFLAADGTTTQLASAAPAAGGLNFWVARTGTGLNLTGTGANLVVTQNGVSRSFTVTDTGVTYPAAPTITSLDVDSGKAGGGTVVKITGTGFSTTAADNTVNFCGQGATVTAATATLLTLTTPNPSVAAPGLGTTTFAGTCPVTVTVAGNTSLLTADSHFTYLTS